MCVYRFLFKILTHEVGTGETVSDFFLQVFLISLKFRFNNEIAARLQNYNFVFVYFQ